MKMINVYCQSCREDFLLDITSFNRILDDFYFYDTICPHCQSNRSLGYTKNFIEKHLKKEITK
jgi:hypothetical protein